MSFARLAAAATALALAAAARSASAQRAGPNVAVAGGLAWGDHRVDMGLGVERSAGTMFDVRLTLEPPGKVKIAATAQTGVLHPGDGATLSRELAEVGIEASYRARDWLDVEGGMRVRSYTTVLGRQRWTLPYLGVASRVPFALDGLEGVVGIGVHPFVAVSGLPDPEIALSSRVGMRYAKGRLGVELVYALDRFDFARGTADQRLEQYSAITARVRLSGLWPRLPPP